MSLPLKAGQNPDPLLSLDSLPSSTHASIAFRPLFSVRAVVIIAKSTQLTHKTMKTKVEGKGVEFVQYSFRAWGIYTACSLFCGAVTSPWGSLGVEMIGLVPDQPLGRFV